MNECTPEQLQEAVDAIQRHGNQRAAAEELEIARSTLQNRLKRAAEKDMFPREAWAREVPEGWRLSKVSTFTGKDGEFRGQWTQAKPDPEAEAQELTMAAIRESLSDLPVAEPVKRPVLNQRQDLLPVYVLADHHFAMYAWAKETGADYDTEIAWNLLQEAMADLTSAAPETDTAIILNVGDFFHSENDLNRTFASGAALDVDSRYARVLRMGIDLTILLIQMALAKHEWVIYKALPGNHDEYVSLALALAVAHHFQNDPRVTVDLTPGYFWVHQFGKVMLVSTHGHKVKPDQLPMVAASKWPTLWGATTFRYGLLGHIHHKRKGGEQHGLQWETFQTLAPKDSWHAGEGYVSNRSMTCIVYHREKGERSRLIHSVI